MNREVQVFGRRKRMFLSARQLFLGAAWLHFKENWRAHPLKALRESLRMAWVGLTSRD